MRLNFFFCYSTALSLYSEVSGEITMLRYHRMCGCGTAHSYLTCSHIAYVCMFITHIWTKYDAMVSEARENRIRTCVQVEVEEVLKSRGIIVSIWYLCAYRYSLIPCLYFHAYIICKGGRQRGKRIREDFNSPLDYVHRVRYNREQQIKAKSTTYIAVVS